MKNVKIKNIDFFKVKLIHVNDPLPSPCFVFLQILPRDQAVKTKVKTKPHTKLSRPMIWAKGKNKDLVITAIFRKDIYSCSGRFRNYQFSSTVYSA